MILFLLPATDAAAAETAVVIQARWRNPHRTYFRSWLLFLALLLHNVSVHN